jgi:hypothetical protein
MLSGGSPLAINVERADLSAGLRKNTPITPDATSRGT